MHILKITFLLSIFLVAFNKKALACSPCEALSNVTQTLNGTNLELTFSSNAGWQCCYTVQIEIVCANANFTGTPNYFSPEICINGGGASFSTWNITEPYPNTIIDLSGYCPGNYKWRAVETGCGIYTPEFTFTLGGASPIQIALNTTQDTICLNQNTILNSNASNGCNSNNFTYLWSPAAGLNNPNLANPVATPSATTTYTLTVSEAGSCTLPQTSNLTITVNPLPVATISGTVSVCQNTAEPSVTFTGSGGTAPYTINYTLNGTPQTAIITSGTATISVPTSTPGVYTYGLTSIQDASNTQCSQNQTETAVITVNQLPVVDAGIDQVLCEPNNQTPSTVTLNGSGGVSYVWDNGVTDGTTFTPPIGETIYTVIGTDANGCTGTDQMMVTSLTLSIATISGTVSVCQNSANPLVTFTGSGGTAPYTINYTLNGTPQTAITTSGTTTISVPTSTVGVYTYVLTSIQDASTTQCSEAQIGTAVITVNQLPIIGAGLDQILCEPNDQTPSTVTLNGTGGVSYTWNNGVTNGTAFTPPVGQTIYTVIGTDANGCTGTDQVMVTSLNLPVAYYVPSDTLGNVLFTVSFTNFSQFGNTYTWDFGDGETYTTSTTETVTHTYDQPGTYTITVLATNGICSDSWSSDIIVLPPMIVEPPNVFTPNGDGLNDFYFVNVENVEFFEATISNRWGNIMAELNSPMQPWDGITDGQEANEGVYFIQFKAVDYGGNTIENHTFFHLNRK